MLVLGIDTSSTAVSVALVELLDDGGDRLVAQSGPLEGRRHGELLAPAVAALLETGAAREHGLGGVTVGVGPGPFTGLRVGVVTAAALGDALGVPVFGVCSLDGLVEDGAGPVVAVTDARRREVYWARYDSAGNRVSGPEVVGPAVLAASLVAGERLVGEGAWLYREAFGSAEVLAAPRFPSPAGLVRRAAADLRAGVLAAPLTPLYLRRPDAQEPAAAKRVTA